MAEKVQGWDTIGVTKFGVLDDGRINLEFTGKDGLKRSVFIPNEVAGLMATTLVAVAAVAVEARSGASELSAGVRFAGIKQTSVLSSDDGREFVLRLVSADGMEIQYKLDPMTTEGLATGLVAALLKHGIGIQLSDPAAAKH